MTNFANEENEVLGWVDYSVSLNSGAENIVSLL
jgi:hypothetical protein